MEVSAKENINIDEVHACTVRLKVVANEDTMLRTLCGGHKCFPVCPRAQHLLRTQNLWTRHKNVSDFFHKHFVSATNVSPLLAQENIMSNNVSATMCPRLPPP